MQLFVSLFDGTDKNDGKQNVSTILLFTTYIKASTVSIENTWNCFKTDLDEISNIVKNFRIWTNIGIHINLFTILAFAFKN